MSSLDDNVAISFMANSILHPHQFSWVFLVDWLMIIVLSIFSIFYFNQLLGLVITHTVGWYMWYRYGVYFKIQSIEISLLGGRVMFRNVTYIGTSHALHIVHGSLSWKYWLQDRRRSLLLSEKWVVQKLADQAEKRSHLAQLELDVTSKLAAQGKVPPEQLKRAKQEAKRRAHEAHRARQAACAGENIQERMNKYSTRGDTESTKEGGDAKQNDQSAFKLKVYGVEWFVYNREYAYEALLKRDAPVDEFVSTELSQALSSTELWFAEMLPLQLDAHQVGVVLGNDDTESIVVVSMPLLSSTIDMAPPSNYTDRYMMHIDCEMKMFDVQMRPNPDFHASLISSDVSTEKRGRKRHMLWAKRMTQQPEPWFGLPRYTADDPQENDEALGGSQDSNDARFDSTNNLSEGNSDDSDTNGLDAQDICNGVMAKQPIEYAKVTQIFGCDYLKLRMRIDAVGVENPGEAFELAIDSTVGSTNSPKSSLRGAAMTGKDTIGEKSVEIDVDSSEASANVTGVASNPHPSPPPLYDFQMEIQNAKLTYGPYAERQRQTFFSVFFPRQCSFDNDSEISSESSVTSSGRPRAHPKATVSVVLLGNSTLLIPAREVSKDSEFAESFRRHWKEFGSTLQRSFGWIELHADTNSKVSVIVPFVPNDEGAYITNCSISLTEPYIRTSVNHEMMMKASHFDIIIDQYQPPVWNDTNTYTVRQSAVDLDLFILREHINLVEDTLTDFADGPPVPYELFTPTVYAMSLDINNLNLFLNVNKGNIINSPTSLSENTFLVLSMPEANITWDIPREAIASPTSKIVTLITAPHVDLDLSAPNWHTLQEFLDTKRLATVEGFCVKLEHLVSNITTLKGIPSTRDPSTNMSRLVNTQILDISGSQLVFLAHGFFIEYIMRVRENYFGNAYHFKTTEEFFKDKYTEQSTADASQTSNAANGDESGSTNQSDATDKHEFRRTALDSDSQMRIQVDRGVFLLPVRLYSSSSCFAFQFTSMDVECRFTNYYMDLQVEIAPILSRLLHKLNPGTVHEEARQASFLTADLCINSLNVHAHRMFGLPPVEPTYAVRWDFELGDITTDMGVDYPVSLGDAISVFKHSFDDGENKPVMPSEELFDVTFITLKVSSLVAVVRPAVRELQDNNARFELRTSSITSKINDLMNERYSAHRQLEIPYVRVRAYTSDNKLALDASTAICITGFLQKQHSAEKYEKQQEHIALHDCLFHRTPFFLDRKHRNQPPYNRELLPDDIVPCIPLPDFPPPLTQEFVNADLANEGLFSDNASFSSLETESYQGTSAMGVGSTIGGSAMGSTMGNSGMDANNYATSGSGAFSINNNNTPGQKAKRTYSSNSAEKQIMDEYANMDPAYLSHESSMGGDANSNRGYEAQDFDEVFPYSSETTTEQREWLRTRKAWFNLRSRAWRINAPSLSVDPEVDNPSMVIQIMPVKVEVTPEMLSVASEFEAPGVVDFEAQLDALQVRILVELSRHRFTPVVMRVHVVISSMSIDLSEKIGSAHSVNLHLDQADVMYSSNGKQIRGVHADFNSLHLSVREGHAANFARINAATLLLSKLDVWWQQTSNKDSTGSVELSNIDTSFASDKIDWTIHYIAQLIMLVPTRRRYNSSERSTTPTKQKSLLSTFYALTMAGEHMGVEQDSYVLSRPSGVVQSRDHIRTKLSWRIVMRLRYLLHRIPPPEKVALQRAIANDKFQLPEDAKQQLFEVYRKWRSWEQSRNIENTEIFHLVFDDLTFQEYVLSLSTRVEVVVESMVARVVYPDGNDHFAGTTGLGVHLYSNKQNETQILSLNFSCGRIRALGSMALVLVATDAAIALHREYLEFLKNRKKVFDPDSNSRSKSYSSSLSDDYVSAHSVFSDKVNLERSAQQLETEAINEKETGAVALAKTAPVVPKVKPTSSSVRTALQVNVSVFLLDLILEFAFDNMLIETQNHQIQFTAAIELVDTDGIESLFHTGTLISANGAFRVLDQNRVDVIDALLSSLSLGYSSRGFDEENNSWVKVDIDSASLVTRKTLEELMTLIVEFLQIEIPRVRLIAEKLHQNLPTRRESAGSVLVVSDDNSGRSRDDNIRLSGEEEDKSSGGKFLNLNIRTLKLRLRLLDDFKLMWVGRELMFKLRAVTSSGGIRSISTLDVQRNSTGVHFGDGSAAVVNLQLDNVRSVMQYANQRLSLYNNIASINAETMSFVWLLEYAQRNRVDMQFGRIKTSLEHAINLVGTAVHVTAVESSKPIETGGLPAAGDISKIRIKVVNRISLIVVKLPLDKSPLNMKVEGVRVVVNQHKGKEALEIKGGIDDLSLELASIRRPPRELVRLKFQVRISIDDKIVDINLQSEYLKLAFDPEAVGALFLALQKLESYSIIFNKFSEPSGSRPDAALDTNDDTPSATPPIPATTSESDILKELEKLRVSLQLNGSTVTWYTDSKSTDGLVIGYEQFKVEISRLAARVELEDAYVTHVGEGAARIKNRMNTIHLPLLEAKAFVTPQASGKPLITTKIIGKTVAVTLVPSVGPWAILLADSLIDTRKTLDYLTRTKLNRVDIHQAVRGSSSSRPILRVDTGIRSNHETIKKPSQEIPFDIKISTSFDRSVLRVFAERKRQTDPAMELFSPKMDVNVEFVQSKLMLRFVASQTSNTVYPMALSEIRAFLTLLSEALNRRGERLARSIASPTSANMFRQYAEVPFTPLRTKNRLNQMNIDRDHADADSLRNHDSSPEISPSFFDQLELDAQIHFGAQTLHLSSQPYSKVSAYLETGGVDLIFTTPRASFSDKSYYAMYNVIKGTRISLQHMYSREISAMIEVSRFSAVGLYRNSDPVKLAMDISAVNLELDLSKLHDMRIFFDVWTLYSTNPEKSKKQAASQRKSTGSRIITQSLLGTPLFNEGDSIFSENSMSPQQSSSSIRSTGTMNSNADDDSILIDKYKNAVSQLPLMYVMNFSINSVDAKVNMGTAIGEAKIKMGRMWLALIKSSAFDQMLDIGMSSIVSDFEGRLGGTVRIENVVAKMALSIHEHTNYPLLHSKIRFGNINFYLGLDFHPFIAGDVKGLLAVLTTQEKSDVADDRIHLAASCDAISLSLTALIIVHAHDVLSLFKRLQSQISLAPIFMSAEAAQETATRSDERNKRRRLRILEYMNHCDNGMRILLDFRLGELLVHVFPTDFTDSVALRIFAKHVQSHLDRHNLPDVFRIGIDLALDESIVSLANINGGGYKSQLAELNCGEFLEFVKKSSSGNVIVKTPEVTVLMDTWEYKKNPNDIIYTFSNQVRGSIDFGWNLGSVNFIKEMLNAHKEAWSIRQDVFEASVKLPEEGNPTAEALRQAAANIERSESLKQVTTLSPKSGHEHKRSVSSILSIDSPDVHSQKDPARSAIVFMENCYIAKSEPEIRIPQIRDLGDATPPIEWLGVNRERIPILIHYFYTRQAVLTANEVEKLFLAIIGRLD